MPPEQTLLRQEIKGFLGVNLRKDRLSLADGELAKAINADLHTFLGPILLRKGRTKINTTALTNTFIRRLALHGGYRYQVAGETLYRDQVSILTTLSANHVTTLGPYRPLNDNLTWTFIADDAVMKKDDGTNLRTWGIAAPTVKAKLKAGSSGSLAGVYTVVYTYLRKTSDDKVAAESNPSPTSTAVTLTSGSLVVGGLTASSDAQVTHYRVYRTVGDGASHLFDIEIPVTGYDVGYAYSWEAAQIVGTNEWQFATVSGTHAVCFQWEADHLEATLPISTGNDAINTNPQIGAAASTLSKPDASLGTPVELDNDVPPVASHLAFHDETAWLCRDSDNPHRLWYAKRFLPESWPSDQFLDIGSPDDPLQCSVSYAGQLGVFSALTKYRIIGNATSGYVPIECLSRRGTRAWASVTKTDAGIIFGARDGVFITGLLSPDVELSQDIAPLFFGETVNDMPPINMDALSACCGEFYKGRYYFSYPSGDSTVPDTVAVFSFFTKKWYFYDHPLRSLFYEEANDQLTGGGLDGFVYVLEDGSTDAGSDIALDVETEDYTGNPPMPYQRKLYRYVRLDASVPSGDTLDVDFYVDGVLKHTEELTGERDRKLRSLPEGCLGYTWRLGFPYTGHGDVRIYGAEALYVPLADA